MQRTFCAAFSLLGLKLLFGSDRALSLGSVFLTACVSMALAFMLEGSGGEEALGGAMGWARAVAHAACAQAATNMLRSGELARHAASAGNLAVTTYTEADLAGGAVH